MSLYWLVHFANGNFFDVTECVDAMPTECYKETIECYLNPAYRNACHKTCGDCADEISG